MIYASRKIGAGEFIELKQQLTPERAPSILVNANEWMFWWEEKDY